MRPGVLGNPFDSRQLGITREESIAKFKEWMLEQVEKKEGIYEELMRLANFEEQGETLVLICACKPKACHGDVIKNWVENEVTNRS